MYMSQNSLNEKIIIGIESSCDETGIGVLKGNRILSNVISSQEDIHSLYGGVVPELASRAHVSRIDNLLHKALEKSKCKIEDIDYIGVTSEPGLKGSLLVGVSFAVGLAYSLKKDLYKVNHLHAHIAANYLNEDIEFPAIAFVVSGGHTSLFFLKDYTEFSLIGRTLDDACGEAFDKVGRMLNLGFPGGPKIEKEAEKGDENKIKFPVAILSKDSLDFSFSGLKTAVLYYIKENGLKNIPDICASFQKTVGDILCIKIKKAISKFPVKSFLLGGGVIQNNYLRKRIKEIFKDEKIKLFIPPKDLCIDNGAMVAILTKFLIKKGIPPSDLRIEVKPTK